MPSLARFQGSRLRDARVARMRTATWLAERIGVGPSAITKYELKGSTPGPELLRKLSEALEVPPAYFFRNPHDDDAAPFLMRSLASSTKRARDAAEVKTSWLREIISFIAEDISLPATNVPELCSLEDPAAITFEQAEQAATRLRRHWNMGDGPIVDLTGLLESNGVVVSRFPFGANKFDAFSKWPSEAPIIADNTERCTAVRLRFDLAHELGHLVMHRRIDERLAKRPELHSLMEKQAHRFAGAFLFPEEPFITEVYTVAWRGLLDLKRRWGISVQAMIFRARHLEMISEDQKQRAFRTVSKDGLRTFEPLDDELVTEQPGMLASAFHLMGAQTPSRVALRLPLPPRDIEVMANLPEGTVSLAERKQDAVRAATVIPFRKVDRG